MSIVLRETTQWKQFFPRENLYKTEKFMKFSKNQKNMEKEW